MAKSGTSRVQGRGEDAPSLGCFLRAQHPRDTAKAVAARTGVPVRSVKNWLDGTSRPNFDATLALIDAYGPGLLAPWMPWCRWVAAAAAATEIAALGETIAALEQQRAALLRGAP